MLKVTTQVTAVILFILNNFSAAFQYIHAFSLRLGLQFSLPSALLVMCGFHVPASF